MLKGEGAQLTIASTGWAAGLITTLTETHNLFERTPLLGFVFLGALGGFAGWALMVETGKLDGKNGADHAKLLSRRMLLGIVIGLAAGVWWLDGDTGNKGLWMLIAGIVAAAPVEMFRAGIDIVTEFLKRRSAK